MPLLVVPKVAPLPHNVPIVQPNGTPTQLFLRQWQEARQINLTTEEIAISLDELQALVTAAQAAITAANDAIAALDGTLGIITDDLDAAEAAIAALPTKAMVAGIVMHGSDDSVARPSGFALVVWIGSVEPTNAVEGDLRVGL